MVRTRGKAAGEAAAAKADRQRIAVQALNLVVAHQLESKNLQNRKEAVRAATSQQFTAHRYRNAAANVKRQTDAAAELVEYTKKMMRYGQEGFFFGGPVGKRMSRSKAIRLAEMAGAGKLQPVKRNGTNKNTRRHDPQIISKLLSLKPTDRGWVQHAIEEKYTDVNIDQLLSLGFPVHEADLLAAVRGRRGHVVRALASKGVKISNNKFLYEATISRKDVVGAAQKMGRGGTGGYDTNLAKTFAILFQVYGTKVFDPDTLMHFCSPPGGFAEMKFYPKTIQVLIDNGFAASNEGGKYPSLSRLLFRLVRPVGRSPLGQPELEPSAVAVARVLLENGANPNREIAENSMLYTPVLYTAAAQGSLAFVNLLLRHGANANDRKKLTGATPLNWALLGMQGKDCAISTRYIPVINALVHHGATITDTDVATATAIGCGLDLRSMQAAQARVRKVKNRK